MTRPPPRVLQVVISLHPGGTERLLVEIVRRSRGRVESAVCCLDLPGKWGERLRDEGTPVAALGREPGFRPNLGLAIARLASKHRANVIHCHQYSPFVYGCLSKLRHPGPRLLFTEHGRLGDAPPSRKRRAANAVLAHVPHRVFTVSDDLRQHLVSEGFRPSQVDVVYNGVDPGPVPDSAARRAARERLLIPSSAVVVCTVARLDPVKDLGTLITSVAPQESVTLVVIGDGPERAGLELQARELRISDRVVFLGHREDARDVLPACDVFANSSIFEGVSLTILEAMAAGLPVVATAVGGTPEIVDGDSGILVPARDPAALANAIGQLATAPVRRETMGAAGRRAVEARFTLDRMVDDYVRVYEGNA